MQQSYRNIIGIYVYAHQPEPSVVWEQEGWMVLLRAASYAS